MSLMSLRIKSAICFNFTIREISLVWVGGQKLAVSGQDLI